MKKVEAAMTLKEVVNANYMTIGKIYKVREASDARSVINFKGMCVADYERFYVVRNPMYSITVMKADIYCGHSIIKEIA